MAEEPAMPRPNNAFEPPAWLGYRFRDLTCQPHGVLEGTMSGGDRRKRMRSGGAEPLREYCQGIG